MDKKIEFETPKVTDLGPIAAHTFTRCGAPSGPPKDWQNFPMDKFGECSSGHAAS